MKMIAKWVCSLIVCSMLLVSIGHCLLNPLQGLSHWLTQYDRLLSYWRYALYISILLCWPMLIQKIGHRRHWSDARIAYFTHQRLNLMGLFMLIEIFFIHNGLGYLLARC